MCVSPAFHTVCAVGSVIGGLIASRWLIAKGEAREVTVKARITETSCMMVGNIVSGVRGWVA